MVEVGLVFRTPLSSSVYLINCCTNAGTTGTTIVMLNRCPNSQKWKRFTERPFGILTLVRYLFPRPSQFSKPHKHQHEKGPCCDYKDIGFLTDCCLALGKLSYPSGFHLLVYRMRTSQQTILEALVALTFQGIMILNLGACYLNNSLINCMCAQSCSVTVRWSVY